MDLKQLEALVAIARRGSFSAAARDLRVTQSALSHQIQKLEGELGVHLFIRARPKVYPSEAGTLLIAVAERVLNDLVVVRRELSSVVDASVANKLRIVATALGADYLYREIIDSFMRQHPEIDLVLTATETNDDAILRVANRKADLALGPMPFSFSDALRTQRLGKAEYVFIVDRHHELAKSRTASLEELIRWPFLIYQPGTGSRPVFDLLFRTATGRPKISGQSNDTQFIKRAVRNGKTIALVPAFSIAHELTTGQIHALRLPDRILTQDFGLAFLPERSSPTVDLFRSSSRELCGPNWQVTLETVTKLGAKARRRKRSRSRRRS